MFQRERHGTRDLIRGPDALSGSYLEQFSELLEECLSGGQPKAVLDMQQRPLIDSAGLECLRVGADHVEVDRLAVDVQPLVAVSDPVARQADNALDVVGLGRIGQLEYDNVATPRRLA